MSTRSSSILRRSRPASRSIRGRNGRPIKRIVPRACGCASPAPASSRSAKASRRSPRCAARSSACRRASPMWSSARGLEMYVHVNGARLYFDVEGAGLVPDGARMRDKPTLLMLHGGPGFDHTMYKPAFSALADIAQVIYLDQRGQGRSSGEPDTWTLANWGDDVKGFCDALGIEQPIVYGGSFGGFVAQSYATRHPEHPGKLILVSTAAHMEYEAVFAA